MMAKTHQAFAVFSVLMVDKFVPGLVGNLCVACCLGFIGALLPDLDSPQSSFGRIVPMLSKPFHKILGHRTVTHSLFAVAVLHFTFMAFSLKPSYSNAICVGYISHIIGDMLIGKNGVTLFWPLKQKCSINPIRIPVAGFGEYVVFNLLIVCIAARGLHQFEPRAYHLLLKGILLIV